MQKRTTEIKLQDKTELELMRHYKKMSDKNFCIEKGFYPLGSCTMKYNPRINEWTSKLEGFSNLHPNQEDDDCQGALKLMYELQNFLKIITGMDEISLQPCAGAHGELSGMMVIKRYFEDKKELETRKKVIIPDNAHGTNPASAAMCGFEILEVKSNEKGLVNVEQLKEIVKVYYSEKPTPTDDITISIEQVAEKPEVGNVIINAPAGIKEIKLNGNSTITIKVNESFKDPGATATDNKDGDITSKVSVQGSVDTSKTGQYTITYSVTDAAGNSTSVVRTIFVYKKQDEIISTPSEKVVYLTFDDGPSKYTARLLDILDKYNVKATFFVVNTKYN